MGHGVKHHWGSGPRPTGHEVECCLSRPPMSSAPAQWPSTVQVVAEGPGPNSSMVWLQRFVEEIHLDSPRRREGQADAGRQKTASKARGMKTRASVDGRLGSHSMRTPGL